MTFEADRIRDNVTLNFGDFTISNIAHVEEDYGILKNKALPQIDFSQTEIRSSELFEHMKRLHKRGMEYHDEMMIFDFGAK